MKFFKLTSSDWIIMTCLFIIGYCFTITQKYFIPGPVRLYSYLLMVLVMYYLIFVLIHPKAPARLANSLAVIFGVVVLAVIIIQDVMIMHIVSWRTPVILLAVIVIPYLMLLIYKAPASKTPKRAAKKRKK